MTLDSLSGPLLTFPEVAKLFPGAQWLELEELVADEVRVRVVEGGLTVPSFEAGQGPWALVVHGDLLCEGDLDFKTTDYAVSLLAVLGNVRARNFRFTNGANCFVSGDLTLSGVCVGRYGDESARLVVGGALKARALLLDHVTGVGAGRLDAVTCASEGWGLPMDVDSSADSHRDVFVADALGNDGTLNLGAAWKVLGAGNDVFLPGVQARLRAARPG